MASSFYRYFSVSSADRQWGFYVTSAGHSIVPPDHAYPTEPHPTGFHFDWSHGRALEDFALLLIVFGKGEFDTRKKGHGTLTRGDVLLFPPGLLHRYRPEVATGWEEYWVTFGGSEPMRWLAHRLFATHIPLAGHNMDLVLTERFNDLMNAARCPTYSSRLLAALANVLLVEAITGQRDTGAAGEEEALRRAADSIRKHPQQFDLHTLAAGAQMGESTFRRKFEQHFGATPARFANDARIEQAKRWLVQTQQPLRVIAERLGFSSEFYLMRTFKRSTGFTPGEWRKAHSTL
jgi:AraC-like DNA-binding protein